MCPYDHIFSGTVLNRKDLLPEMHLYTSVSCSDTDIPVFIDINP